VSPGQRLCQAFADTFEGGGWAEPLAWEDFDEAGQARWERAAARLAELTAQGGPMSPAELIGQSW